MLITVLAATSTAAPYAAMVIDARDGKVLHSSNADTRLHPASLTKMMTLYVAFEAVARGEITLDTRVKVSSNASAEPASKLYLKTGQRIELRYLIRAAAVKSANDAATAIAEAVSGSEAAFAQRMTRTAKALGMSNTQFKNAHGLTQSGHYSTARDMTTLGRHLFYDYPEYYNLFSRRTTNAGGTEVSNTNRRFLAAYRGADGIKTGYTRAAGFNLVASAQRGDERIIATMFGGSSTAARNKRVAELLDIGFAKAPSRVAVRRPALPRYTGQPQVATAAEPAQAARVAGLAKSAVPQPRPVRQAAVVAAVQQGVDQTLADAQVAVAASTAAVPVTETPANGSIDTETIAAAVATAALVPMPRPNDIRPAAQGAAAVATPDASAPAPVALASASAFAAPVSPPPKPRPVVITFSSSDSAAPTPQADAPAPVAVSRNTGGGGWGIDVGLYGSRYEAERILLKTALIEIETLDDADRQVQRRPTGFAATFTGLSERTASLACQRLSARQQDCTPYQP
jgi:D-alanyl-D-alanine carboxypeptidase